MDEIQISIELLSQIKQIKWILVFILAIFFLGLAGIGVLIILMKKAVDEDRVINTFKDKTSAMLDKDDLDGVIKYCNKKLEKYPKEMYAHWYLAQAYYRKKEYHKALEELTIVSETTPSWKEHYVDPYIDEIKEKLKNSKPEIVKS